MGRKKRGRKLRSVKKMVRIALRKQEALHYIQIATIFAMYKSAIAIIKASRTEKMGFANGGIVSSKNNDECILLNNEKILGGSNENTKTII